MVMENNSREESITTNFEFFRCKIKFTNVKNFERFFQHKQRFHQEFDLNLILTPSHHCTAPPLAQIPPP